MVVFPAPSYIIVLQWLRPTDPLFSDDTASPIVSEGSVIQGHTQVYLGQSLQIYRKEQGSILTIGC